MNDEQFAKYHYSVHKKNEKFRDGFGFRKHELARAESLVKAINDQCVRQQNGIEYVLSEKE